MGSDSRIKGRHSEREGGDRNDSYSKKAKHCGGRDLTQALGHKTKLIYPASYFQGSNVGGISRLGEKEAKEYIMFWGPDKGLCFFRAAA